MNAAMSPADTKTRILDAAERTFSQDGFDAASLRTITTAAQVNLAAVNYHFHSKEALFSAVVERRATPLNKRRIELLEAITCKPTVERILEAFLHPVVERATELALFKPLMARLHSVPVELHQRVVEENFAPTLSRFIEALSQALPNAQKEDLKVGMFFVVGAMSQAMAWERVIAGFMHKQSHQVDNLMRQLVKFGAAGVRATAAGAPAKANTKRVNH